MGRSWEMTIGKLKGIQANHLAAQEVNAELCTNWAKKGLLLSSPWEVYCSYLWECWFYTGHNLSVVMEE